MTFFALFLIGLACLIMALLWLTHQNDKTLEDRVSIINKIDEKVSTLKQTTLVERIDASRSLYKDFDSVTYEDHLWARVKLRDWKKLYPESIQEIL